MNQCLALKPSAANGLLLSKPPPGPMSFFHFTPMPNHRRQGYVDSGRLAHANRRATRLIRALTVMSSVGACLVLHHLKHRTAAVGGIFPSPSSIARGVALRPVCRIAVVSRTCRWSAALHLPARVCPAAAEERSLRPTIQEREGQRNRLGQAILTNAHFQTRLTRTSYDQHPGRVRSLVAGLLLLI